MAMASPSPPTTRDAGTAGRVTPCGAGVPAVGVQIRVDDEGEVLARSNHVFEGYWNQPDETRKAIVDGWFHTGDSGYREGPYVAISDRKKDVIITGGENVSSIEVEDCLFQHPAVAEAAVIGVPDPVAGQVVKAFVLLKPGHAPDEGLRRDLMAHARRRLGPAVAPRSIAFADSLPHTRSGKIMRRLVRARELGLDQGDTSTVAKP